MMFIIQIIQRGLISFNEFTVACRCFNIRALALLMPLKPLKRSRLCDISLFDNWKSICTVLPYLSDNQWMLIPFFVKCWYYPPKWAWKSSMKGKQTRVSELKGKKRNRHGDMFNIHSFVQWDECMFQCDDTVFQLSLIHRKKKNCL